jgi:hypothetical protein
VQDPRLSEALRLAASTGRTSEDLGLNPGLPPWIHDKCCQWLGDNDIHASGF